MAAPNLTLTDVTVATYANTTVTQNQIDANQATASINWGDNTAPSAGTLQLDNGNLLVGGTHTFPAAGTYNVATTLSVQGEAPEVQVKSFTVPPPVRPPVPTWAQLASPSINSEALDWQYTGKIPTDLAKANSFPTDAKFSFVGGYRERFANSDDQEVSFVLDVPWGQLAQVRCWFLGYSWIDPQANPDGSYTLHREPPYQCTKDNYTHLYARDFQVLNGEGVMALDPNIVVRDNTGKAVAVDNVPPFPCYVDRSTARDGNAKVRVTCAPRKFVVRSDSQNLTLQGGELNRYVIRGELQPAVQSLPLPQGSLVWGPDAPPKSPPISPSAQFLLAYTCAVPMTWCQVPSPPFAALRNCVGKVNSVDFDFGSLIGTAWPAGSLLCQAPPKWTMYRQCSGLFAFDCPFTFLYRASGWNFFPSATGDYFSVCFANPDGTPNVNKPLFKSADFNTLFQPGAPIQWD